MHTVWVNLTDEPAPADTSTPTDIVHRVADIPAAVTRISEI
jgi:hypothetical protein